MKLPEDPAIANRRRQLKRWIDAHFAGSQALFIASTNDGEKQLNQGELSALLKNKTFGERRARSLELQAKMPPRYLEQGADAVHSAHTAQESSFPSAYTGQAAPHAPTAWPFSRVSLSRIVALKRNLGPRQSTTAMQDIDETLELVVAKWERRATPAKSAA